MTAADFIKRVSEVCGVPRSTLKKWRQQYLNGIYTEGLMNHYLLLITP